MAKDRELSPKEEPEDDYGEDELEEDDDEGDFHIPDRLEPPETYDCTTEQLHKEIHHGIIDLYPPYQRDPVWPEHKQIMLLDSLWRGRYIPPVVFALVDEDGEDVKRCVDGKQRLTSIQNFLDGMIPYRDPRTKKSWYYTVPDHVKGRNELPEHWKRDFAKLTLKCAEYRGLSQELERDIFQRVQLGMPLTAAEKLQAIASTRATWITTLSHMRLISDEGLGQKINVDLKRGRDFQSLAQFIFCCESLPELQTPSAQKIEAWISQKTEPTAAFKKAIDDTLGAFWYMAGETAYNRGFVQFEQRVAPVEFMFIGILLFVMRNCTIEQRAEAIFDMRAKVRKDYVDIRMNARVVRALWVIVYDMVNHYDCDQALDEPTKPQPPAKKKRKAVPTLTNGDSSSPAKNRRKTAATT